MKNLPCNLKKVDKKVSARGEKEVWRSGQLRFLLMTIGDVLAQVFGASRPADRVLGGFFREHRQCGARDRKILSEGVFGLFRHWGVLCRALPPERRRELEAGGKCSREEAALLLAGALELEGKFLPLVTELRRRELGCAAEPHAVAATPEERAAAWARKWNLPEPESADWTPDWLPELTAPDFPLEALRTALRRRPPMWLRCQGAEPAAVARTLCEEGLSVESESAVPGALAVREPAVNLFTLESFRCGEFEVQDLASQAIGLVANPRPGERWWDACAGAGGKTLQLAELMRRRGTVVAADVRDYKLEDLRRRARRAGFPNIQTRAWDGKALRRRQQERFDGVLVDAPCSCSGVWRRNPDGRWHFRPEEVPGLAALQLEILTAAAGGVRPGGVLIYATCSIFPAENEEVVAKFLATHADFAPDPFPHPLTGAPTAGMMNVLPGQADCDQMFAARLRRRPRPEEEGRADG